MPFLLVVMLLLLILSLLLPPLMSLLLEMAVKIITWSCSSLGFTAEELINQGWHAHVCVLPKSKPVMGRGNKLAEIGGESPNQLHLQQDLRENSSGFRD